MQNTKSLILRSPEADPLDMPASAASTGFPLLMAGKLTRFNVLSIEVVDAKSDKAPQGAKNIKIVVETAGDEKSADGDTLHKGYPVSSYIALWTSEDRTQKDINDSIGTFIQAVEGKATKTNIKAIRDTPEQFLGKPVDAKVSIKEDKSGKYGPSNSLRWHIPK